jgi:cytochrome bd-type quinol oxidase subunit 2
MVHIVFFYAVLLGACTYAGRAGGAPERCVAVILVAGTIATWAVAIGWRGAWLGHFRTVEYGILLVDCLMLAALLVVAMVADRFWPLWMTAIHGFGVVAHLAKAIAPDILPGVYKVEHAFSAYPGLILLILATRWHRQRLRETGRDPSWSRFSPRAEIRVREITPTVF